MKKILLAQKIDKYQMKKVTQDSKIKTFSQMHFPLHKEFLKSSIVLHSNTATNVASQNYGTKVIMMFIHSLCSL